MNKFCRLLTWVLKFGVLYFNLSAGKEIEVLLQKAGECFPNLKNREPSCEFLTVNSKSIEVECVHGFNPNSEPAMRIIGEYNILKIVCSASYEVDFRYYGTQVFFRIIKSV